MLYDASLQALYILADASKVEERAQLYLDYLWIEKDKLRTWFDNRQNPLAKRLSKSPRRAATEPHLDQNLMAVESKYKMKSGKYRFHWYPGSLKCLAKSVDLEEEYELLQSQLSGAVHSSIHAVRQGAIIPEQHLVVTAWQFVLRVLGKFAEHKGIDLIQAGLTEDERQVVLSSHESIYAVLESQAETLERLPDFG